MNEQMDVDSVLRTSLAEPGYTLVDLGSEYDPLAYRARLVTFAKWMIERAQLDRGCTIAVMWAGRFDQQTTTRPHRDDAPDGSVLILGYEPTTVQSRLEIVDFSRYGCERGMSPREWLRVHNPMYHRDSDAALAAFTQKLTAFDSTRNQMLAINNSVCDGCESATGMLGVLHQATILTPDPSAERIVNSIMLADAREVTGLSDEALVEFVRTGGYGVSAR